MMNIQNSKDCGHCERNALPCAMFLVPTSDLGEEVFYLCFHCVTEAAAAITAALPILPGKTKPVLTARVQLDIKACKGCGRNCVNEYCDDCARRVHP